MTLSLKLRLNDKWASYFHFHSHSQFQSTSMKFEVFAGKSYIQYKKGFILITALYGKTIELGLQFLSRIDQKWAESIISLLVILLRTKYGTDFLFMVQCQGFRLMTVLSTEPKHTPWVGIWCLNDDFGIYVSNYDWGDLYNEKQKTIKLYTNVNDLDTPVKQSLSKRFLNSSNFRELSFSILFKTRMIFFNQFWEKMGRKLTSVVFSDDEWWSRSCWS